MSERVTAWGKVLGRLRGLGARWKQSRGQSIVEMALFFPILLVVMVSIVEVGNALNAFLTVENITREGARFGAAGGTDLGITEVVTTAMDLRLDMTTANTDLFIIRGETSADGTAISNWTEVLAYGAAPPANSGVAQGTVLGDLQSQGTGNAGGLAFVAVAAHYDLESMLGVPLVANLADMIPLSAYSVMQMQALEAPDETVGCRVYPIAVSGDAVPWTGSEYFTSGNDVAWLDFGGLALTSEELAGYLDRPGGGTDVHIGDTIEGVPLTGAIGGDDWDDSGGLLDKLDDHVSADRTLLAVVFDPAGSGGGSYEVAGFITLRIGGYQVEDEEDGPFQNLFLWYGGEYTSCGQEE